MYTLQTGDMKLGRIDPKQPPRLIIGNPFNLHCAETELNIFLLKIDSIWPTYLTYLPVLTLCKLHTYLNFLPNLPSYLPTKDIFLHSVVQYIHV